MPDSEYFDAIDELALDPLNPRLRDEEEDADQGGLLSIMSRRFRVDEIAESILVSGWLDNDPLMGFRGQADGEPHVIVLEGNRRLAAVKMLLDPGLAPDVHRSRWEQLSRQLAPETRAAIQRLRVLIFDGREDPDVASYIGYRHVAGVLPWAPMEKAEYIDRLVRMGFGYDEIAERLGSRRSHMRRHHVAFLLVTQATTLGLAGARQMGDGFGLLLRALQTEGVKDYLGVIETDDPEANRDPVPASKHAEFGDFVAWTFGTDTEQRILPESRELTKWGRILSSPSAVAYLRRAEVKRFERAWMLSGGEATTLSDALWRASYTLSDSVPLIGSHLSDEQVVLAARECVRFLEQIQQRLIEVPPPDPTSSASAATEPPVAIPGFDDDVDDA